MKGDDWVMERNAADVVDAAKKLLKSYGYCVSHLWHVSDVHCLCEQNNLPPISDADAMDVLMLTSKQFDGETGISWPQLERALRLFMRHREVFENLREIESEDQ